MAVSGRVVHAVCTLVKSVAKDAPENDAGLLGQAGLTVIVARLLITLRE
jgi:hypothetical protein